VSKKFDTAEVIFERRSHAISAIKKFHGLTLDGVPMKVMLAGERGLSNPFDPHDAGAVIVGDRDRGAKTKNVREGLFGTRGDDSQEEGSGRGRGMAQGGINFGYKPAAGTRTSSQRITVTIKCVQCEYVVAEFVFCFVS
jgi:hypothetical protein